MYAEYSFPPHTSLVACLSLLGQAVTHLPVVGAIVQHAVNTRQMGADCLPEGGDYRGGLTTTEGATGNGNRVADTTLNPPH